MKTKFTLILLLITLTNFAFAQNQIIYLVDSLTKIPVPSATVQNEDLTFFETSNQNGVINLTKIPTIKIDRVIFIVFTRLIESLMTFIFSEF